MDNPFFYTLLPSSYSGKEFIEYKCYQLRNPFRYEIVYTDEFLGEKETKIDVCSCKEVCAEILYRYHIENKLKGKPLYANGKDVIFMLIVSHLGLYDNPSVVKELALSLGLHVDAIFDLLDKED